MTLPPATLATLMLATAGSFLPGLLGIYQRPAQPVW